MFDRITEEGGKSIMSCYACGRGDGQCTEEGYGDGAGTGDGQGNIYGTICRSENFLAQESRHGIGDSFGNGQG